MRETGHRYRVVLEKEDFKFSAAHFTIFADGNAEPLHGHNYTVSVEVAGNEIDELGFLIDFYSLKKAIRAECDRLDEKTLIPRECKMLDITEHDDKIDVAFQDRRYSFPRAGTLLLPIPNTTVELFAREFWGVLAEELRSSGAEALGVGVQETNGQRCYYEAPLR